MPRQTRPLAQSAWSASPLNPGLFTEDFMYIILTKKSMHDNFEIHKHNYNTFTLSFSHKIIGKKYILYMSKLWRCPQAVRQRPRINPRRCDLLLGFGLCGNCLPGSSFDIYVIYAKYIFSELFYVTVHKGSPDHDFYSVLQKVHKFNTSIHNYQRLFAPSCYQFDDAPNVPGTLVHLLTQSTSCSVIVTWTRRCKSWLLEFGLGFSEGDTTLTRNRCRLRQ